MVVHDPNSSPISISFTSNDLILVEISFENLFMCPDSILNGVIYSYCNILILDTDISSVASSALGKMPNNM